MWFIGVEVLQEISAPPPKKNPGSTPVKASDIMNLVVTQLMWTIMTGNC